MDNQGAGTRKIVFKHRSLGVQQSSAGDAGGNLLDSTPTVQSSSAGIEEAPAENGADTTLHYQGEIFDQFYRPLSALGGDARLVELAGEPLVAPDHSGRLSAADSKAKYARHQQAAEALAAQIYQLAQVRRETDVDVYLSAFNVVLATHDCYDAKDILDRANEYFTERYYNEIRERGERPEIYHQVIKRVGPAAAERIGRIVAGLDVYATANRLWDLYHGRFPSRTAMIADVLLDCTERQVRTLRAEFLVIPYRDIARQLRSILFDVAVEGSASGKKTIGRNEAADHKRSQAYRTRDQLRAMRYLLLGRSSEEISLIKRFFVELDTTEKPEHEKSFDSVLQKMFLHVELDRMGSLFQGWSPEREAEELHNLLYPQTLGAGIDDYLSDPRDAVDRDFGQGIGPFLRRFKKNRMWRSKSELSHRLLNVFELVEERVAALTIDRFMATNEVLLDQFGYELDPSLFRSFCCFNPRSVAGALEERVKSSYDFFEMVKPIEFLGPRECLAVQKAYACMYGIEIRDAIDQRLSVVHDRTPQSEREELYARYLDGRGRWPLAIDLLGRYHGHEEPINEWSPEFVPNESDEQLATRIAQELDQEARPGDLDGIITALLSGLSQDELARLERSFFELTDPPLPLQKALIETLSPEAFCRHQLATYGINEDLVCEIAKDPFTLTHFRHLPTGIIKVVRSLFQVRFGTKIDLWLISQFPLPEDEDVLIDLLSIAYAPETFAFRVAIQELRRDIPAHIDGLRRFWSRDLVARMGMERAIDRCFPRFRVHIKQAAARHAIQPALLAEIMLSFEGVDPIVTSKILECFDAVDIKGLQRILRDNIHDQRIIEESYDLLFPDAQLRTSIKAMKVDLDLINETLLHLDGYSAEEIAAEVHALIFSLSNAELGAALNEVFAPSTLEGPNPRIPADVNWMDEMMYQVGLAYERLYQADMFDAFAAGGVPLEMLEALAASVFGSEVCGTAQELHTLIMLGKKGEPAPDNAEEQLASFLESRGVRHRDRVARAYAAFWARQPGAGELSDGVTAYVKESNAKRKILALLAGLGRNRPVVVAEESVVE
jgi:hypothetical protein